MNPNLEMATTDNTYRQTNKFTCQMLGWIMASYLLNTLFLVGFVALGVLTWSIPIMYGVGGVAINLIFYLILLTGLNRCFTDRSMGFAQNLISSLFQVACIVIEPKIGFIFMLNLFTICSFGILVLDRKQIAIAWVMTSLALLPIFFYLGGQIGLPNQTTGQSMLTGAILIATLGRCVYVANYVSRLRARMLDKNTELAESLLRIENLATRDDLTQVLNRRSLFSYLKIQHELFKSSGLPFCIAMVDIDHFKQINDRFGHLVGDEILRVVTQLMQGALRANDQIARFGGDEFAVVMSGTTISNALVPLQKLCEEVRHYDFSILDQHHLTVSIGVTEIHGDENIEQLIERADQALYQVKMSGRDGLVSLS